MRTPAAALLWESWRLTRGRVAFVAVTALVAGWGMLAALQDEGEGPGAFLVLFLVSMMTVVSVLSTPLVGARYGFPFRSAFARPVATWALVAVPMAYLGVVSAALYVVPILVLQTAFGTALPLWSVAAWIAVLVLFLTACSWWTRSPALRFAGWAAVYLGGGLVYRLVDPESVPQTADGPPRLSPEMFDLSTAELGVLALLVAASFGLGFVGVNRQRHDDDQPALPAGRGASRASVPSVPLSEWLRDRSAAVLRARCPTTSPTLAELWLEARCRALPVFCIGVVVALTVPVLLSVGNAYDWNLAAVLAVGMLVVPFLVAVNIDSLGSRRNAARESMSAFEATRPIAARRLVAVQVLVTVLCVLAAWAMIGTSLWLSLPLFSGVQSFEPWQARIAAAVSELPGYRIAAWSAIGLLAISAVIALLSSVRRFNALYGRRMLVGLACITSYAVAVLLAVALGWLDPWVIDAHLWALALGIPLGTALVVWRALADRVLAPHHVGVAIAVWLVFAVTWLGLLQPSAVRLAAMPSAPDAVLLASTLLPLAAVALAPWSLSLLRST